MQSIPIHQAKSQLSELIRAAEQGEDVVLTRHGKPVVRLVAERAEGPSDAERERIATQALDDLRAFRALWRPAGPGEQAMDWKSLRDEGRKY
jgi:prevent-host-death family protein